MLLSPPPAASCSWQVSSLSETKAHQVMQQKAATFIQFNQRQLSRIYPSSYRVDSSNFNPQPFWSAGCQLGTSPPTRRRSHALWPQGPRKAADDNERNCL